MKKIIYGLIFLLICSYAYGNSFINIHNDNIYIELKIGSDNNIQINQIYDIKQNICFIKSAENKYSLWSFKIKNNKDYSGEEITLLPADSENMQYSSEKEHIKFIWKNVKKSYMKTGFNVTCYIDLSENSSYWKIEITPNRDYGIWNVTFPYISDINCRDGDCLSVPFRGGSFIKEFSNKDGIFHPYQEDDKKRYKDIGYFLPNMMQWSSLTKNNSTVYFSPEDTENTIKTCNYLFEKPNSLNLVYVYYPEHMGEANYKFTMSPFNISLIQGDWYDACKNYRKWGIKNNYGAFSMGKTENRKDLPEWWKKNAVSFQWNVNEADCVNSLIYAKNYIDMPVLLHAYLWNKGTFDTAYPNWLPCREGFKNNMKKLKNMGYFIMPYTNGHLTDINNSEYYRIYGDELLVKNENNEYPGENCGEKFGASNKIACPGSIYKNVLKNEIMKIMKEIDFDALYMDQIGSSAPSLCFNDKHSHSMGGGSQYGKNYTDLIIRLKAELKNAKGTPVPITTEDCSDIYPFDGWLRCNEGLGKNADCPLNTTVYSGYVISFGDYYWDKDFNTENQISAINKTAVAFTKGIQPGWAVGNRHQFEKYPKFAEHFKNMAHGRYKAYKYFNFGEIVRPVKITNNIPIKKLLWSYQGTESFREYPAVREISHYYKGKVSVSFINITEDRIKIDWEASPQDLNLKNKKLYKITKLYPDTADKYIITKDKDKIKSSFTINSLETAIFIIE